MLFCLSESFSYEPTVQLGNLDSSRMFSEGEIPLLPIQKRHSKMKLWNDKVIG